MGDAPSGDAPSPLLSGAAEGVIGSGATGALDAGTEAPNSGALPNTGDTLPGDGGVVAKGAGAEGAGDDIIGAAMKLGGVTMPGMEAGGCTFGGGAVPMLDQAAGATGDGGSVPGRGAAVAGAENMRVKSPGPDGVGDGAGGEGGRNAGIPSCVVLRDGY